MDISVLISTKNNADRLRQTLFSIGKCHIPAGVSWEVVVVNHDSNDHTEQVAMEMVRTMPLKYAVETRPGLGNARNLSLSSSSGRLVIFTDDDVEPDLTWIAAYWAAFIANPTGRFWGGPIESIFEGREPDRELVQLGPPSIRGLDLGGGERKLPNEDPALVAANWACPSTALRRAGGFDARLGLNTAIGGGEESDLMNRLIHEGMEQWYIPGARIAHIVPAGKASLKHIAARRRAYGRFSAFALRDAHRRNVPLLDVPPWIIRRFTEACVRWVSTRMTGGKGLEEYLVIHETLGVAERLQSAYRERSKEGAPVDAPPVSAPVPPHPLPEVVPNARFAIAQDQFEPSCNGVASTSSPTVSIVIPAFNTAAYISDALDSVLAQTYKNFEVIVINDGSPDTEALEKALEPYLERIVYIRQENRGPSAARNAGIRRARGEFIAFLDSDDVWLPQYLFEQLRLLSNSPKASMIYSDAILFGGSPLSGKSFFEAYPPKSPANFENLLNRGSIMTHCVIVRKKALFEAGLFDEELFLLEDIHLWLRIAHLTDEVLCNRQVLARRRYRHRSQSHVTGTEMAETQIRYLRKLGRTLDLSAEERSALERETEQTETDLATAQGKRFLSKRDFPRALHSLTIANRHRPSAKLQLTIYGLRVAPRLTRHLTLLWQSYLNLAANAQAVKARERLLEED